MCFSKRNSHRFHLTDISTRKMTDCNYLPKHFWGQSSLISCNKSISNPCKTTYWAEICKFKAEILQRAQSSFNPLRIDVQYKFYHQCYQSTTTAAKHSVNICIKWMYQLHYYVQQTFVKHLRHIKCFSCQKCNSRCMNSPSNRSLANPGSAPVERTKSDRTASISKVMWSWIHRFMGDIHIGKKNIQHNWCNLTGCSVLYLVLAKRPHLQ